jgi:hypothetical protein
VTHVLGCHVEMKRRPRRIYPLGATYQPHERAPEMTTVHLKAIRDATASIAGRPGVHRFDDFIILNDPGKNDLRKLVLQAKVHRFLASVARR